MKLSLVRDVSNTATLSKNRIVGLDLIRVFAVYYVFVGHGLILVPDHFLQTYSYFTILPISGTSVLFLLSGFLIGSIFNKLLIEKRVTFNHLKHFWLRRVLRIVPSYFFVLVILLLLGAEVTSFDWKYLIFSQNLFQDQADFFKVGWALSLEMWFYLLFPLVTVALLKFVKNRKKIVFITVCVFLIGSLILRLMNFIYPEFMGLGSIRKVILFRIDSTMYGVFASVVYAQYKQYWEKYSKVLASIGVLSFVIMFLVNGNADAITSSNVLNSNTFSIEEFYHKVTIFNIEVLPILFFIPVITQLKSLGWRLLDRIVIFLSKLSYAVFLTHASLVLWFLIPQLEKLSYVSNHASKSTVLYLLYVLLTFVFSLVLYYLVVKPSIVWSNIITTKKEKR